MKRRTLLTALALVAAIAGFAVLYGRPMINDVTTGQTPEYPDLQAQQFDDAYETVFAAAAATLASLGIEITSSDPSAGTIRGVATTRIFRFKDDVTITLTRGAESTIVNIRSASRVGRSDFGMNAKRIRTIQADLSARLR